MIISFPSATPLERALHFLSFFTLIMTVPQVLSIWIARQTAGVSLLSWAAYLISALLWLVHGLRRHDRSIWVPCIGWIVLDVAIVVGVVVFRV